MPDSPLGTAGAQAGGSLLEMLVGNFLGARRDRAGAKTQERHQLLQNANEFTRFLAQLQATSPTHAQDTYQDALLKAGKLRIQHGTGTDPRTGKVTNLVKTDPALEQLAKTYADPGTSNLGADLKFIPPEFNQATSLSAQDASFTRGGRTQSFGRPNPSGFQQFLDENQRDLLRQGP